MNTLLPPGYKKFTLAGFIITLGIVFGDIGTSPLYVLRAIAGSSPVITDVLILGGISCVIWTLTLQTTIKYVMVTLRADNRGEGGIFALYALIRKRAKWAFLFAIIGGATLLADGIITPAITVVSAIEGLNMINPNIPVLPIVITIICILFFVQHFGTDTLGKSFGPMMFAWFLMLAIMGFKEIIHLPTVLKAFNPWYAYQLLMNHPGGFLLLGAVFLCTTGAEALYSDLGHCGIRNIQMTWIYVKVALILNYLGQGAWLLTHPTVNVSIINPFYAIMPSWFLIPGIIIATLAAVIASQALISGSFSIINEAILLNFWPKLKTKYPAKEKGQMYIPAINYFVGVCCIIVILVFKKSQNMEAAYGLSITITMLMTTVLLGVYALTHHIKIYIVIPFISLYLLIEGSFLIANLNKFSHGGWLTILIAGFLFLIMYIWYKGRELKNKFTEFEPVENFRELFNDLQNDSMIPKFANNLVYMTRAVSITKVESKIVTSIFSKQPKRADHYWLLHVDIADSPHTLEYQVTEIFPGILTRIDFKVGFQVQPRVNLFFKEVVSDLVRHREMDPLSSYPSLRKHRIPADFRFILIDRVQNYDFDFPGGSQLIMDLYAILKRIGLSDVRAYGLDTSNVYVEKVSLAFKTVEKTGLKRVRPIEK